MEGKVLFCSKACEEDLNRSVKECPICKKNWNCKVGEDKNSIAIPRGPCAKIVALVEIVVSRAAKA